MVPHHGIGGEYFSRDQGKARQMSGRDGPRIRPRRQDAQQTRGRLRREASRVFAEQGYEQASLRDICSHAEVGLGAVAYYFGSKQGLYREIVVGSFQDLIAQGSPPSWDGVEDPELALGRWIRFFLRIVFLKSQDREVGRLLTRELTQPTGILDDIVSQVFMPLRAQVRELVAAFLGLPKEDIQIGHLVNMVIGSCTNFEHSRHILERLGYPLPTDPEGLEALADRVSRFVLGGLREFREGVPGQRPGR